jgi:hypothetical protein
VPSLGSCCQIGVSARVTGGQAEGRRRRGGRQSSSGSCGPLEEPSPHEPKDEMVAVMAMVVVVVWLGGSF